MSGAGILEVDAVAPVLGVLRVRDVRAVLGPASRAPFVDAFVLGPVGERASAGRVGLGQLPGGGGARLGLRCPGCGDVVQNLLTDNAGGFRCRACRRRRTRRQLERSTTAWAELGGREEDHLLRDARRGAPGTLKNERMRHAIDELLADDRARVTNMVAKAEAAIETASAMRRW